MAASPPSLGAAASIAAARRCAKRRVLGRFDGAGASPGREFADAVAGDHGACGHALPSAARVARAWVQHRIRPARFENRSAGAASRTNRRGSCPSTSAAAVKTGSASGRFATRSNIAGC